MEKNYKWTGEGMKLVSQTLKKDEFHVLHLENGYESADLIELTLEELEDKNKFVVIKTYFLHGEWTDDDEESFDTYEEANKIYKAYAEALRKEETENE